MSKQTQKWWVYINGYRVAETKSIGYKWCTIEPQYILGTKKSKEASGIKHVYLHWPKNKQGWT